MKDRFLISEVSTVGPGTTEFVVEAPRVAAHAHPGQFVIVRPTVGSERIPLTICDFDAEVGTITLVVQAVGRTTTEMQDLGAGEHLADVLGPLGAPTEIDRFGTCVVVAGGVGVAIALPVARALTAAGNEVIGVLGARTTEQVILRSAFEQACRELAITTEDGSVGTKGFVTDALLRILDHRSIDRVFAVGPIAMMRAVSEMTRDRQVPTIASLNPIMVDGTGMCGGCRVSVGGDTRFACVDGPEFDAHLVDFDSLERRNTAYRAFESCQLQIAEASHG
ncbi:MAG TPA: sulfide/dihydroorotate dehydrogenase-like FAD/NAD-binding protein [Acidimicrobiia bacterium]|nr:sulfide/dihydroorotate dehydrogenase-like FAD/NAD-binding protein [Acidimicrobiia bacterium]